MSVTNFVSLTLGIKLSNLEKIFSNLSSPAFCSKIYFDENIFSKFKSVPSGNHLPLWFVTDFNVGHCIYTFSTQYTIHSSILYALDISIVILKMQSAEHPDVKYTYI